MLVVKESKIQDREAGQGNNKHVLCIRASSTMKMDSAQISRVITMVTISMVTYLPAVITC